MSLVKTLEFDPGADTLSRWMSHYISEQISVSENSTGEAQAEAKQRCFETILKLWTRRASFPNNSYPFEKFELVFKALEKITSEGKQAYYFNQSHFHSGQPGKEVPIAQADIEAVQPWINMALAIDGAARALVSLAFQQAAHNALDEESAAWIEKASGIFPEDENDISIIVKLIGEEEESAEKKALRDRQSKLQSKVEKLNMFMEVSNEIKQVLEEELKEISQAMSLDDSA